MGKQLMWICLTIDEGNREEIVSLCRKHMEGLDLSGRFLDFPLHVSLKRSFYSDAFEKVKKDLCGYMGSVPSFEVKEVSLQRVGDMLWIRVCDEELMRIHERIDRLLKERYDIEIDMFDRNYLPHITLFRDEKKDRLDAMYERLQKEWKDRTIRFASFYIGSKMNDNEFFKLSGESGLIPYNEDERRGQIMKIIETTVGSKRNTQIPVTIVEAQEKKKLLLCIHGFKANRTEDGRFLTVAKKLAEKGICSIMMGFPGCDVSKEDFINYTLKNCISDIDACYTYMKENYDFSSDDVGMIGYSMGGRLTSLYIADHPEISCIGLWAAAVYDGFGMEDGFLGVSSKELFRQCEEKGYVDFHNGFDDTDIRLAKELIEDMASCKPSVGLSNYTGCAIVVHGDEDVTVPYATAETAYELLSKARERKLCTVHEADHGFGQWNERPELSKQLTDDTIAFFERCFVC